METDSSGASEDPEEKYFHESTFHYHYDGRFASETIPEDQRIPHLRDLVKTYLSTMIDIGAETWIMHGTLLGWWWNQQILPWDTDIDAQVSEGTMHFLAKYYNMTEYHFKLHGVRGGRTYLLEINPHFVNRTTDDWMNVIDARWIDTSSGLFVDITSVREDFEARKKGHLGALMCKDRHKYLEQDIFPLRDSYFEDMPAKIPYDYTKLLADEYGPFSLTNTDFNNHVFNVETKMWEPKP
ncbi:hypothetical protein EMCG_00784 [[Emmonsia] crescens]|uniref:LicD/FKTN/FKRP nucleotidyltransferase domain-containing protein n=1 Tax=[Emmonsia] crescens TaxID=73230 RepID=A0A0G2HQ26_9EURO|nr:hypothetical protein EMCG_00784 [Emmonsia crescens UAMH 3008]